MQDKQTFTTTSVCLPCVDISSQFPFQSSLVIIWFGLILLV